MAVAVVVMTKTKMMRPFDFDAATRQMHHREAVVECGRRTTWRRCCGTQAEQRQARYLLPLSEENAVKGGASEKIERIMMTVMKTKFNIKTTTVGVRSDKRIAVGYVLK